MLGCSRLHRLERGDPQSNWGVQGGNNGVDDGSGVVGDEGNANYQKLRDWSNLIYTN